MPPEKRLREITLSAPVSAWLAAQGYTVYSEVPFRGGYRKVDLVGKRGEEYCCVELKTSLSRAVLRQAYVLQLATPRVYVGVGTVPRESSREDCAKVGVGILCIAGNRVTELLAPRDTGMHLPLLPHHHFAVLAHMTPGGQAGRPTLKGEGPAQDVARRVAAYRRGCNPHADWKELFKNVSNHYANPKSMRYSLEKRGLA